jgi:hypothetical protein
MSTQFALKRRFKLTQDISKRGHGVGKYIDIGQGYPCTPEYTWGNKEGFSSLQSNLQVAGMS